MRFFLDAFVIAGRARTVVSEVDKIEMARVTVGPSDVHTRAAAHVNLHAGRLASRVDGKRHEKKFYVNKS